MDTVVTDKPPAVKSNLWKQLIAFGLAAALLYFSFRGCDFAQIWSYAKTTNPLYIVLLFASCLMSHALRALRWIYLLLPIENRKVSLWNSFVAVMLGYAVNVPLPRGGEVARLVSISRSEKLPWAGVLPTMLIDRMLDLVMLGLVLGLTVNSLPAALKTPQVITGGTMLTAGSVVGLFFLPWMGHIIRLVLNSKLVAGRLPEATAIKLGELAAQFEVGTKSLTDKRTWPMVFALTPVIWGFYGLNLYFNIAMFNLQNQINLQQASIVFASGSLGVLIPAPGSVGTYHWAVKTALVTSVGLNENLALAFVTVGHLVSFILVPCVTAAICLAIQSMKAKNA